MTEDEFEVGRITVSQVITSDPDEGTAVDVDIPGELNVVTALGMLEIAKAQILRGNEEDG